MRAAILGFLPQPLKHFARPFGAYKLSLKCLNNLNLAVELAYH